MLLFSPFSRYMRQKPGCRLMRSRVSRQAEKPSEINRFQRVLVRVARLERAASTSQMWRPTNWATPGYFAVTIIARKSCDSKFFLSVVIYVVKAVFGSGFVAIENPASACVARVSRLWLFLSWIDGESLPNYACCQYYFIIAVQLNSVQYLK